MNDALAHDGISNGAAPQARGHPRGGRTSRRLTGAVRPTRVLIGLAAAATLSLGLAAPASAAVVASFSLGTLSVFGDAQDNTITISRNAAGTILVNGGAVAVLGGTPSVANTALIQVFGQAGNDQISLDEASGALPAANLFGGAGNDVLTGGSGADQLFGQSGNDTLLGKGGADFVFGGTDNDTLTGGDADDQVLGESGDDRMVWNPGDDTDLNEGGAGTDTTEVNGGGGAEVFTATANGTRVRFDRLDPAPFALDIGTTEKLTLNANGGDDSFAATGNLAALIQLTVDGGAGNDTVNGSNGADLLLGGDGSDTVDGQQGNDVAFLGAGDDVFIWDPGDGSDTVEGQDGADTLRFNGSGGNELFDAAANGNRVRFTRNLGNVVMDLDDVERFEVNALGGADTLTVNTLGGTDATEVRINLAGALGGTTSDGQQDIVIVNGTSGADAVQVTTAGSSYIVSGLAAAVHAASSEGAHDQLVVNTLAGDDSFAATGNLAPLVKITVDGGAGNDTVNGSNGADLLLGGDGSDTVDGQQGNDVAFLGAGDDVFIWDPGDGSDTVEGQAGADTLRFNGSGAQESVEVSANGGRIRFFRNIGNVVMDLDDVERAEFNALGGVDTVTVNDLTGTDARVVAANLAGTLGGSAGDGQPDTVVVNGTAGEDTVLLLPGFPTPGSVTVAGPVFVEVRTTEAANDTLRVNGLAGGDAIDARDLAAGVLKLVLNGGDGDDVLVGSAGDDVLDGGAGDDALFGGPGTDVGLNGEFVADIP